MTSPFVGGEIGGEARFLLLLLLLSPEKKNDPNNGIPENG